MEALLLGLCSVLLVLLVVMHTRGHRAVDYDFWDWVTVEIERARRYERSVSLLWLVPSRGETAPDLLSTLASGYLRPTDQLYQEGEGVYVLAPEIDRARAHALASRLVPTARQSGWTVRIVSFPEDAITERGLKHLLLEAQPSSVNWDRERA